MNNKRKAIVTIIATMAILSFVIFSFLVPNTYFSNRYNSTINENIPLFNNYNGSILSETIIIKNASQGVINANLYVMVSPLLSIYPFIPGGLNITHNESLLNSFGPTFTLVAKLMSLSGPNSNITEVYGENWSENRTNRVVGATFFSVLWNKFGFMLNTVPINIGGGNYDLQLLLYMKSGFPIQNSNYSSLNWVVHISNLTVSENVNGYLFKSSPVINLENISKYNTQS